MTKNNWNWFKKWHINKIKRHKNKSIFVEFVHQIRIWQNLTNKYGTQKAKNKENGVHECRNEGMRARKYLKSPGPTRPQSGPVQDLISLTRRTENKLKQRLVWLTQYGLCIQYLFRMAASSLPPSGKWTIKSGIPESDVKSGSQVKDGRSSLWPKAKPVP